MAKRKVFEAVINAAQELRKLGGTQAERMARAAEQGYDTGKTWYHGTGVNVGNRGEYMNGNIESFDPSLSGKSSKTGAPEGSFFFTNSPEVASGYTMSWKGDFSEKYRDNANVIPAHLRDGKTLKVNARGDQWSNVLYRGEEWSINDLAQYAKDRGYDGLEVSNVIDHGIGGGNGPQTTKVMFDPSHIRSVNADFNPEYRDSPNLLAGIAGAMPYAAGTAALLAGATGSQEAEAGPLQTLGRAAPYLTSAALGGAAALQSGDAEAGKLKAIDALSDALKAKYNLKTLHLFETNAGDIKLESIIVDNANRKQGIGTAVMKEINDYADASGKRVILTPAIKDDYQGTTSRSRLVDFYKRSGYVENKGRNKDFAISAGMYRNPIDTQSGNATPALLAATAVGTGAGMYAASDAEAGKLDALGRAAPYLATGALGAAMMTPQDAQAEPISIMPPNYNDTMQRTQAAINKIDQFKAKRAGKRGAMDQMKLELQTMLKGANMIANDVLLPELEKADGPLKLLLGFGGVFGALAQGKSPTESGAELPRIMAQPADQTTYELGGRVTDTLSPYVPAPVAAGAGALTHAGALLASPF